MPDHVIVFLNSLILSLPMFIVWSLAFIISINRWHRHPQVSKLAASAAVALIVLQILAAATVLIPLYVSPSNVQQLGLYISVFQFLLSILSAVAWGLVIKAIFGWRKPRRPSLFLKR